MKNNTFNTIIRNLFGKSFLVVFLFAIFSVASFAQSQTVALYNKSNNGHEGYIYVYASTWQINWSSPGLVTYVGTPCTTHSDSTWTCTTVTYSNGQPMYRGEIQSFTSHIDFNLRNTHKWVVNHWETEYNDGWTFYYIK